MQTVQIRSAVRGWRRHDVYERLKDGDVYVRYAPEQVKSVSNRPAKHSDEMITTWEIYFRNGILSWTELDVYEDDNYIISFLQTEGDFDVFEGNWHVGGVDDDLLLTFTAIFDFGVPSMEAIVNPVAVRVLRHAMAEIIRKLFGGVVIDEPSLSPIAAPMNAKG